MPLILDYWERGPTRGDIEAAAPLRDGGVLVLPDGSAPIEHHAGALVSHAELVAIDAHAGHARHREVERRDAVAQIPRKGEDEAAQACVHVAGHPSLLRHLGADRYKSILNVWCSNDYVQFIRGPRIWRSRVRV